MRQLWLLVAVMCFTLAGCGLLDMDKDGRSDMAKAGIQLAVGYVGDVLADDMREEGEFTEAEIDKVEAYFERRASKLVDRIWHKVEEARNR